MKMSLDSMKGEATVKTERVWFHINLDGSKSYPECYDWAGNYQEHVVVVRMGLNSFILI